MELDRGETGQQVAVPGAQPFVPRGHEDQRKTTDGLFPIAISGLSKRYRQRAGELWALRGIEMTIMPGVCGILGRNGAGKTTLLHILATLLEPSGGTATFGPYDIRRDRRAIRAHLGYLPQDIGFYPSLTAAETLRYLATLSGIEQERAAVADALEAVNLTDQAHKRTSALSGGMRRRLGLAQALLGNPGVVIVDEPTAGLDPIEQQRFRILLGQFATQGSRTILLSTHTVADMAASAQQVAVLELGRLLYFGSVSALAARAESHVWEWRAQVQVIEAARREGRLLITAITAEENASGPRVEWAVARVIGEKPAEDAHLLKATLEDGYFALIGKAGVDEDGR